MSKQRRLLWSLGLSALMGLMAGQVRAETITMTLSVTGAATSLNVLGLQSADGRTFTVEGAGLNAINGYLSGAGSEYTFQSLGGSSNWSGGSQAVLTVTGEVNSLGSGNAGLTLTETESGFISPVSPPSGTLVSSSSATFTNQPAGGGNSIFSTYNTGPSTPTYSVLSSGTVPNSPGNTAMVSGITAGPASYSLMNTVSFALAAGSTAMPIKDQFTTSAVLTVVPEPASLVMFMTGMPLPLVLVGLLRRRRRAVAQG